MKSNKQKGGIVVKTFEVDNGQVKFTYTYTELLSKGVKITCCVISKPSACYKVEECHIPDIINGQSVVSIGRCAFSYVKCEKLYLPNTKCCLNKEALSKVQAKEVIWPESITTIPNRCFASSKIGKIVFEDASKIKKIDDEAFAFMSDIDEIEWPSHIKAIPRKCFSYSLIKRVTGLENVRSIGSSAFEYAENMSFPYLPNLNIILSAAFIGCKSVEEVILPPSCQYIYDEAFKGCENLKRISHSSLWFIGERAFEETGLTEFVWPNNYHMVPKGAFKMCRNLEAIHNADSIHRINAAAFEGTKLTNVTFNNLVEVDSFAFCECPYLSKFEAPNLDHVGPQAFSECKSLGKIVIEQSPSIFIRVNAFNGSGKIKAYFSNCEELELMFKEKPEAYDIKRIGSVLHINMINDNPSENIDCSINISMDAEVIACGPYFDQ